MALLTFSAERIEEAGRREMSDALERGLIVFFPQCPIELPEGGELLFMREELPRRIVRKNISFHPEVDRVSSLKHDPELELRVRGLLATHSDRVLAFLRRAVPTLIEGCTVGTSSFRPLQERGRQLGAHASNELIHVDAGAYGATLGDRILRFFVNVNPDEDRVWATKGTFPELYQRYGREAGIAREGGALRLEPGLLDRARGALIEGLSRAGLPAARVLNSSPYDRLMRRFHNYMKDTQEFQAARQGHVELSFPPFSAWMVLTDMVSHACLSGQHALVNTFLPRLEACRLPELAPINILRGSTSVPG
jgi:hypothetical protein